MQEYICPKCMTRITVAAEKRLLSLYCRNCMKTKQLNMLRLIQKRRPGHMEGVYIFAAEKKDQELFQRRKKTGKIDEKLE